MNSLIEHIERLLLLHDCVIIPDFGGFVLQSVSASHDAETNIFFPPRKEVVYNQTLDHNDGLLIEAYMKKCGTDFSKAQQTVRNNVTLLKDTLENEGELSFGSVGLFVKDEERLVFVQGKNSDVLFASSSFGLPVFHFLPLQNRKQSSTAATVSVKPAITIQPVKGEHNKKSENKNILYKIPVTKAFVRIVVAVAAAILLFLLISTPVKDVDKESYKASFVPQEIMPKKTAEDIVNESFAKAEEQVSSIKHQEIADIEQESKDKDISENNIAKIETFKATPATVSGSNTPTSSPAKTNSSSSVNTPKVNFYVIIGSFATKTQANTFIKSLKGQEARTAGIITVDGHVRVYAQGFVTEKSAYSYMNKLRQSTKHKQAWTCKVKN
ncbi:MAG: SPOR domain-containing protein [Tannerella sp.]|jgi:cell division septation protein DedD|nr:SPOR domain-containing protein [Tannerella sp.]